MARAGYEDGYDPAWMPLMAHDRRTLDKMLKAASEAKKLLDAHEEACWRETCRRTNRTI